MKPTSRSPWKWWKTGPKLASRSLRRLLLSRLRPWPVVTNPSGFAKSACVCVSQQLRKRGSRARMCVYVCEWPFLFLRGIIWYQRGRAPQGRSPHTAPPGRRTNNNKLRKRLCQRIHERSPVVDSVSSSVFFAPLSSFLRLLLLSVRYIPSTTDPVPIGWTCIRHHEMLSLCRLIEDNRDNSIAMQSTILFEQFFLLKII